MCVLFLKSNIASHETYVEMREKKILYRFGWCGEKMRPVSTKMVVKWLKGAISILCCNTLVTNIIY